MHRFLGKDPNGLAQGDFAEIARLLPEVYRAAAGRWMPQPQVQPQAQPQAQPQPQPQSQAQPQPAVNPAQQNMQTPNAQPSDLGVQPSQGLTAQNPQQPQVQAIPAAEDLTDIRQKLAALDTMMQGNPAYVEARRRGDWQTAAREAEKAGHHDLARVYQMLHEKMTGAPLNVTPYQNPAAKAGDEQGAARPTPAPVPVHPVDSLHPVDIPKSVGARRDFGRGLIKAMRMRNLPIVDTLKEGLRDGRKDALKHALKRIAQADEEDAILRGETAAQRANDGDEAQAEPREKQDDEVQAKSAQNEGKEKTADEGGLELADGYTTESGRPLSEADEKEFIIKPNGSRNFGEITKTISDAVMQQSGEKLEIGEIRLRVGNRSEGLIHAKAHEKQAQDAGYDSIENLIADVAENYDQIYMRAPEKEGQKPSYSLVKLGNKSQGVLNGVAPVYFELQSTGDGSYYIVVSAMPKGDKPLAQQAKKDRLIYSSPSLGAATKSNAGADSASTRNVGADTRGGFSTSDKSSGLVASTIPSEQEKSKEKSVQAKSAPLTKQEQEALTDTSEEAKEAYRIVRDKLAKSKNKAVVRAAKVGATLFARHADIYAKAYSKATGKPYTALDYLHDKFGLDADGKEADGRADGLGQRTSADVPASQKEAVRKQYAGTALWMKAPNGKATNLTEDQWLTVRTPAFKAWFGDWEHDPANASKVVDENGEPLVVYHATLSDFTKFRPSESGLYGRGIYLTADKEDTSYTLKDKDWRVMELFANIRNPRDPEAMASQEDIDAAKKEALDFFEKHPFDKDGTPASFVVNNLLFWGMQPGKVKRSKLTQVLQDAFARKGVAYQESDKHDGAIIQRDGATWYTADQPNQVKSATDNKGAFSAADEDIYNQRAWVGSAADFDEFDLGYVGTGEGAQVHGYGLYTAQDRDVAEGYKERLSALLNEAEGDLVDYNYVEVIRFNGFRYEKPERWDVWIFERGTDDEVYVDDPAERAVLEKLNDVQDIAKTRTFFEEELEANRKGECGDTAYSEDTLEKAVAMLSPENIQDENLEVSTEAPPEPEAFGGTLFEVEIPEDDVLLDEQKPLAEQPEKVQEALGQIAEEVASQGDGSLGASFAESYKEMDGREIYEALVDVTGSPEDASTLLNEHGVEGITYNGRQDGRCFVVFDDKAIEIINKFNQRMNDIRKGSITPQASGRRVISLFEKADESTFLHEMGHMFLMDLEDVAALDEASAEDLETVRDWAAWQEGQAEEYEDTPWQKEFAEREKAILQAKKSGDAVSVRKLKREWEQERFARGFERYLETGKAPTSVLQRIFQTFKKFLKRIYQAFNGTGGKASPEVEAVMGRMIAEDAERASGESEERPVQAKSAPIQADFSSSKIKGWTGKTTAIVTDSGEEIPVRYRLVEAKSLVTSNNAKTFLKNPAYPKSLQPRDRERANMQQQIVEMTSRLRPEDLAESRSANLGAPVVRADGVVLNGNGRAIAITRALLGNTFRGSAGAGYRAFLKEHAKEFGFKPKAVSKMRAPMLVREITAGLTKEQVEAVTTSTTGGSRLGASEQAKQDAEKITLEDLSRYEENERGDLTTAANRGFVSGILYHVSGKNDVNAYTDAKGQVNADGIQRVKRALFQKAYGDDHLLSRMSESTDDDTRNITNGLTIAAPYIARANEKMARGTAHGYKIGETIADAVKRYNHLHDIGQSVEGYLDQQAMFAEHEDSPEMREVLRVLNENRRSGKRIAQFVRRVGEIAEEQGNPNEISLMEGGEPLSLGDVIREAKKGLKDGEAISLFDDAAEIKKSLVNLARAAWNDKTVQGKVSFKPSQKLRDKVQELFGHDIDEVFITADDMRHIKNDHSEHEEKRGQVNVTPENISDVYDVVNSFDEAELQKADSSGNQKMLAVRNKDGKKFALLIERGKRKAQVKTYYAIKKKQPAPMSDAQSPERNVQNDSADTVSSASTIAPEAKESKRNPAPTLDTLFQEAPTLKNAALQYGATEKDGRVTFENPEREKDFKRIAEALQGDVAKKLSAAWVGSETSQEVLSKVLKEVELVAPEKLTKRQQGIADFGKAMGMPVVFFKGVTNLHGFHASNGVTFLNTESETSLSWTFWHEALHWMKANNEELFGEIIEDVEKAGAFTKAQLDGYREEIGAPELSDADVIEEMLADALPDVKRRVPFMKNLGKRNKSLAERLVGWIREVMDRFRDFFHTPARGLTKAQSTAMRNAFAALARDMVDERGRRIFRIDGVGRRITLANGAPLPSAKYSLDNREGRGDNEDKISKAVFDKHLNDGIMKMVEERVRKEIGEHVDFAACCDPVARDAARDGLPYIKDMLTKYNQLKGMKAKPEYLNRQAVKIEYARRCFDNDERIRNEAVRRMVGVQGQGAIHRADVATLPTGGQGESRGNGRRAGLSRSVSGEKSGARAHFEQLYEDMKKHPETGAFSMVKFSRNNRKPGSLGLFRRLLVGLKLGEEAVENLEVHRSNKEKQLVIPASKLNKFMVDKSLTEKNILKTEDVGNGNIRVTYMPRDFHNIKAMRMRNIPVVDTLKEGLRDGRKDALKHALKRIAQVDEKMAYFSAVARFCFATKKKSQNFPRCPLW